jgi:hypothetical protein
LCRAVEVRSGCVLWPECFSGHCGHVVDFCLCQPATILCRGQVVEVVWFGRVCRDGVSRFCGVSKIAWRESTHCNTTHKAQYNGLNTHATLAVARPCLQQCLSSAGRQCDRHWGRTTLRDRRQRKNTRSLLHDTSSRASTHSSPIAAHTLEADLSHEGTFSCYNSQLAASLVDTPIGPWQNGQHPKMVSNMRLLLGSAPSHSAKQAAWKARPQRAAGHVTLGAAPAGAQAAHSACKRWFHEKKTVCIQHLQLLPASTQTECKRACLVPPLHMLASPPLLCMPVPPASPISSGLKGSTGRCSA